MTNLDAIRERWTGLTPDDDLRAIVEDTLLTIATDEHVAPYVIAGTPLFTAIVTIGSLARRLLDSQRVAGQDVAALLEVLESAPGA